MPGGSVGTQLRCCAKRSNFYYLLWGLAEHVLCRFHEIIDLPRAARVSRYCARWNNPTYAAFPRTCPAMAFITALRISCAFGLASCGPCGFTFTSMGVSTAYNSMM